MKMKSVTCPCRRVRSIKLLIPPAQTSPQPMKDIRLDGALITRYTNRQSKPTPTPMVSNASRNWWGSEVPRLRKEPRFSASRSSPTPPGSVIEWRELSRARARCFEVWSQPAVHPRIKTNVAKRYVRAVFIIFAITWLGDSCLIQGALVEEISGMACWIIFQLAEDVVTELLVERKRLKIVSITMRVKTPAATCLLSRRGA
jgi:hypothetical protein